MSSLFLTTGDTSYISQTVIDGNSSGSVVRFENGEDSTTVLNGLTIKNGLAWNGGGVHIDSASINITYCNIVDNRSTDYGGGGIFVFDGALVLKNSILESNQAYLGGGIRLTGNTPTYIQDCTFKNNHATGFGGAIRIRFGYPITISNSYFESNQADTAGGAIYIYASPVDISHSVFTGNSTGKFGGAIFSNGVAVSLDHNTIVQNYAEDDGGGYYSWFEQGTTINNTIIWGNSPNQIFANGWSIPTYITIEYSDIMDSTDGVVHVGEGSVTWGTGNISANPLFCNPDSSEFSLAENSPCLGTGENGTNMGALDVGCGPILAAYENQVGIPDMLTLHPNYPNPFNPITTIRYKLPKVVHVRLVIYDLLGREMRTLVNNVQEPGFKSVVWDGKNGRGQAVLPVGGCRPVPVFVAEIVQRAAALFFENSFSLIAI